MVHRVPIARTPSPALGGVWAQRKPGSGARISLSFADILRQQESQDQQEYEKQKQQKQEEQKQKQQRQRQRKKRQQRQKRQQNHSRRNHPNRSHRRCHSASLMLPPFYDGREAAGHEDDWVVRVTVNVEAGEDSGKEAHAVVGVAVCTRPGEVHRSLPPLALPPPVGMQVQLHRLSVCIYSG